MTFAKDFSISAVIAGFITVLVGFTGAGVIVFQAAQALEATPAEISSWMWALGLGMRLTSAQLKNTVASVITVQAATTSNFASCEIQSIVLSFTLLAAGILPRRMSSEMAAISRSRPTPATAITRPFST